MKALSVRGDYVMQMINGTKKIEYRSWATKYRGPLLMCSTAKKIAGAVPGYALCVAKISKIAWNKFDRCYYWYIDPFKKGGSYLISPIHVKGQLKLFNVADDLIKPVSKEMFWRKVKPMIYQPKRKKANIY